MDYTLDVSSYPWVQTDDLLDHDFGLRDYGPFLSFHWTQNAALASSPEEAVSHGTPDTPFVDTPVSVAAYLSDTASPFPSPSPMTPGAFDDDSSIDSPSFLPMRQLPLYGEADVLHEHYITPSVLETPYITGLSLETAYDDNTSSFSSSDSSRTTTATSVPLLQFSSALPDPISQHEETVATPIDSPRSPIGKNPACRSNRRKRSRSPSVPAEDNQPAKRHGKSRVATSVAPEEEQVSYSGRPMRSCHRSQYVPDDSESDGDDEEYVSSDDDSVDGSSAPARQSRSSRARASHGSSEGNRFVCTLDGCDKGFQRKHDVLRHVVLVHLNGKVTCVSCGQRLARRDGLKRHIQSSHPRYDTKALGAALKRAALKEQEMKARAKVLVEGMFGSTRAF